MHSEPGQPSRQDHAPERAVEPVRPSPAVRAEFEQVLQADTSLIGDVWRRTQAGETPEEIQSARDAGRPNFVWNYRRIIDALLEGDLPSAPTVALAVARKFRSLLRTVA